MRWCEPEDEHFDSPQQLQYPPSASAVRSTANTSMDSSTHDSPLSNPPASTFAMAVTAHDRLLAACPCLNIKLHLASEPEENATVSGKETKLGLAGVSVVRHLSVVADPPAAHTTLWSLGRDRDQPYRLVGKALITIAVRAFFYHRGY